MKLVIGLVGEKGSGKQTFVNFLKELCPNLNIRQLRFSDILAQTLILWDLPTTRVNLQKLSLMMNTTFGETALANAAKFSIEDDESDIIVLDGIRRPAEAQIVKNTKENILIYISAKQNLRYERLKKRSEKVGETGLTLEQFLAEEESKAESLIPSLGKKAKIKIENNETLDQFRQKIKQLLQLF